MSSSSSTHLEANIPWPRVQLIKLQVKKHYIASGSLISSAAGKQYKNPYINQTVHTVQTSCVQNSKINLFFLPKISEDRSSVTSDRSFVTLNQSLAFKRLIFIAQQRSILQEIEVNLLRIIQNLGSISRTIRDQYRTITPYETGKCEYKPH